MKCRGARWRAVRSLAVGSALGVASACTAGGPGGGPAAAASAPAPQPVAGDVERTTFAPSLGIDLSRMMRRVSGLYVQDLTVGTGSVAATGRTAVLEYSGWLPDGKQFDSGEITVTLGSNKVIRAWEEGVLGMRVGGRRRIVSPPQLAYGERGAGPDIPPNAVLVFEFTLADVY
jgi:peptidylprolyl isomerase